MYDRGVQFGINNLQNNLLGGKKKAGILTKLKILRWSIVVKNNHENLKTKKQYEEIHEKQLGNKINLHVFIERKSHGQNQYG